MRKIFVIILVFAIIFSAPVYAEATGMTFTAESPYQTVDSLSGFPATFEATVTLPSGYTDRAGVIIGSFYTTAPCFNFEIYQNGQPRIYCVDEALTTFDYRFDEVNVSTGSAVHIAAVMDRENSKAYCYINGELKQTLSDVTYPSDIEITTRAGLGGDMRSGNSQYFKGEIHNVRLYSDVRTAEEILSDISAEAPDSNNLIAAYDLSGEVLPDVIEDLSGNGNDFHLYKIWITEEPALAPYAYSFAMVGDTQIVNRDYPQHFSGIYDWILDNAERFNTKFIFGLGDITDQNTDKEYALADAVFTRLKGVIPFSFVRGNHDTTAQFNRFFTTEKYGDQISGCYDGKMTNTYHKFDVGNIKYMAVNIDMGASDAMLAWANEICEANPDRNIIVTTHGYMGPDGTVLSGSTEWPSRWGPNSGAKIWDKFIKKHKNIVLVVCGHKPSNTVVVSTQTGDKGNVVTQLLIDPQGVDAAQAGGVGLVTMLHFSEDGRHAQVRCYSTIKKAYYLPENQFDITLETVTSSAAPIAKIVDSSLSLTVPSGSETDGTITLDNDKYTFITDTKEKCTLSLDVSAGTSSGKIIAALYDNHIRLKNVKVYDCADIVKVSFDNVYSGDKAMVHWWDGTVLMPIGNDK